MGWAELLTVFFLFVFLNEVSKCMSKGVNEQVNKNMSE